MFDKVRHCHRVLYPAVFGVFLIVMYTSSVKAQTFSTPQPLSNTASNSSYPSIVVDSAGNINAAWVDSSSGINFRRSTNSGQSFSPSVAIPGSAGAAFQPQMIVDPTRSVVEIAWAKASTAAGAPAGSFDLFVTQLMIGAVPPPTPTAIARGVTLGDSPRLAFDGAGVDVVWGKTQTWISQSPDGITFGSPNLLSIAAQDSGGPRIAVDKSGNIFVAWTDRLAQDQSRAGNFCTNETGTRDANGVLIFSNTFGGNFYLNETLAGATPSSASTRDLSSSDWKGTEVYPNGYFGCSYDSLQLFFDQNDNLHLLWAVDTPTDDLLTSIAVPQAGGTPLFSFPINLAGDEGASSPSGASDSKGSIHVAWAGGATTPSNTEGIYFSRSDNDGTNFPEATVVSAPGAISPAYPQVAVDSSGNVNLVWEQADQMITASGRNTFHLFFAHSTDRGNTFPTVRPVQPVNSGDASVLCIPVTPTGGTPPTTADKTTCGTVQMALDASSNGDIVWVNNPASAATANFSVATVAGTPPQDFSIGVNPGTPTAYSGETVTFTVSAQAIGSFNSPITIGCNDFPEFTAQNVSIKRSDSSCASTPASVNPGGSATVNLAIPAQLPAGTYSFAINGTSGGTTHRVTVSFTTAGPAGSVTPTSATINTGASASFNATINPGPFTGNVTFQCAGQPSWIQCAFNPTSVTASSTSTSSSVLTVTVVSKPTSSLLSYPHALLPGLRGLALAAICAASLFLLLISAPRRQEVSAAILLRGMAVILLTLALSIGLTSCGGATAPSSAASASNSAAGNTSGSGGSGGSSNPVTVNFNVQAQSGTAVATLGVLTITAQ